jgi:phage terminase large subunit-like protein
MPRYPEGSTPALMGSQEAAGQLQQRPAPAEGNIIKRSWWKFYSELPEFDVQCLSADLTFKDTVNSDFVVLQVWGRKGANKYLLDQVRARLSFTESLQAIKNLCAKWPNVQAKYIEDAANGAALFEDVFETGLSAR